MIAGIILSLQLLLLLILLAAGRRRFREELSTPLFKNFKISLKPATLYLLALTGYRYNSFYEKKLKIKLGELYGGKNINACIRIFIAQKLSLIWIVLLILTAIAIFIDIDGTFLAFGALICGAAFFAPDHQLDSRLKKRTKELQRDFPEFINKLILLVDAGMPVRGAIQKIVEGGAKDRLLIIELMQTLNEISSGKPEIKAYEDFAKRCRLQDIISFSSALIQNLRKGSDELVPILKLQSVTCWQNRRNLARKSGEEASSKLLIPVFITFIAIMIMLMAPAIMQMKI